MATEKRKPVGGCLGSRTAGGGSLQVVGPFLLRSLKQKRFQSIQPKDTAFGHACTFSILGVIFWISFVLRARLGCFFCFFGLSCALGPWDARRKKPFFRHRQAPEHFGGRELLHPSAPSGLFLFFVWLFPLLLWCNQVMFRDYSDWLATLIKVAGLGTPGICYFQTLTTTVNTCMILPASKRGKLLVLTNSSYRPFRPWPIGSENAPNPDQTY